MELIVSKGVEVKQQLMDYRDTFQHGYEQKEEEFLVIKPSTSSTATSSVITLGNGRFLDVRKSLLLRKALVEDRKQEVVVVCTQPASTASCIRPTTSAANDCEPD